MIRIDGLPVARLLRVVSAVVRAIYIPVVFLQSGCLQPFRFVALEDEYHTTSRDSGITSGTDSYWGHGLRFSQIAHTIWREIASLAATFQFWRSESENIELC